jgi:hypothetical protein
LQALARLASRARQKGEETARGGEDFPPASGPGGKTKKKEAKKARPGGPTDDGRGYARTWDAAGLKIFEKTLKKLYKFHNKPAPFQFFGQNQGGLQGLFARTFGKAFLQGLFGGRGARLKKNFIQDFRNRFWQTEESGPFST